MTMMRLLTLLVVLALAVATPSPSTKCPSFFGVSKRALQTRGGDVHELTTLEDVNSIVLTAGSNNQLVVIDFSECSMKL